MLSEEQVQEMKNRLSSENAQEKTETIETKDSSQEKEVKQEQSESSSRSDGEEEKSIPYSRFKEVNQQKGEYKQKYETLQKEFDDLKKERERIEKSKVENKIQDDDSWLDEFLESDEGKDNDRFSVLDQRLKVFERERIEKELENQVQTFQKKYSDMDAELVESIVYKSIAENPDVDLDKVLESTFSFIQSIEKKAMDKLEKQGRKEKSPPPTVPSRPSMTKDSNVLRAGEIAGQKKVDTVQDASQRLREYLAKNKLFS